MPLARTSMTAGIARPALRFLALGGGAALCLGAAPGAALGAVPSPIAGDLALEYRPLPGCPDETALRERTADLFDFEDPFVPHGKPASIRIRVEIADEPHWLVAHISLLDPQGHLLARTRSARADCDTLVWLVAHRLRLMILRPDPAPSPGSPPQGPPSPPSAQALVETAKRLDRLEEKAEDAARQQLVLQKRVRELSRGIEELRRNKMDLTYTLSAGVLMTANLTSDVGPGVWLGGDVRFDPVSVGLELRSVLPARFQIGPYDNDMSQYVALVTPCGRYSVFFGCVVAGAGFQMNYDSNYSSETPPAVFNPLVQLGGRAGVEIPLGESRFAIRGWAEVLYSTPTTEFSYTVGGAVSAREERPDVSAFFGLGLVVKLGEQGAK